MISASNLSQDIKSLLGIDEDSEISFLHTALLSDLLYGPRGSREEDPFPYGGFKTACDRLSELLSALPDEVYLEEWSGEVVLSPDNKGDPADYRAIDVKSAVFSKELKPYI